MFHLSVANVEDISTKSWSRGNGNVEDVSGEHGEITATRKSVIIYTPDDNHLNHNLTDSVIRLRYFCIGLLFQFFWPHS